MSTWAVEHLRGAAATFHEREVPARPKPALWWFEVDRPAVVLGSTQARSILDGPAAERSGIEIAQRRSGGGAVYLAPGEVTWVDVILPATDPRWQVDVSRSFHWLGDVWRDVLGQLGHAGAEVHRGPMQRTRWSDLVCFAGLGPGEVLLGGRKVVGISQRRTREAARFQCALLHQWDPAPLVDVLALPDADRREAKDALIDAGFGVGPVSSRTVVGLLQAVVGAAGA